MLLQMVGYENKTIRQEETFKKKLHTSGAVDWKYRDIKTDILFANILKK